MDAPGGCGPVGDNTNYGRRVFQSIYLHGIRELSDAAGLWTFENFTDFGRIDPILIFLFYPDGLTPASPGNLDLRTSFYFEIDRNRAGNVFARSEWDSDQAAWFNFVTRYSEANHTHYDMNSFLFTAFGEPFATHDNIYLSSGEHHGADFEHNIVVIDEGGMPVADRSVLFVKQGPNPYIVVADDIQKDSAQHDYHWQWFTPARSITGAGSLAKPFVIEGENARCKIAFLAPETPSHDFQVVKGGYKRRPIELGLLRVNRKAVRTTYLAVAAAWRKGAQQPVIRQGPPVETTAATAASTTAASAANNGAANAATSKPASIPTSIIIEGEGFRDQIVWRRNDTADTNLPIITAGKLQTDALMALVRTDPAGAVTGYLIGDGKTLTYNGQTLAQGPRPFSVSAEEKRTFATGPRRSNQALPPHPAQGQIWLPHPSSEIWADDKHLNRTPDANQVVKLDPANPSH